MNNPGIFWGEEAKDGKIYVSVVDNFEKLANTGGFETEDKYFFSQAELDVAPQTINGRTLLPIRVLCEALGADVSWDGETQTVIITCPQELIDDINKDTTFIDEMIAYPDELYPEGTTATEKLFTILGLAL